MIFAFSVQFICLLKFVLAFPNFQEQIPNGNSLPHPCKENHSWLGVGHENSHGGGKLNQFGEDFKKEGFKWTKTLCVLDSDGDGQANGEELGDPTCTWTLGATPTRRSNITHPGVCDPYYSDECKDKNTFLICKPEGLEDCDTIKDPDVRELNFTVSNYQVPSAETTYTCLSLEIPKDDDYYVVATDAIVDNSQIVHHMFIYGCDSSFENLWPTPLPCGMSIYKHCRSVIAGWTLGSSGMCFQKKVGFRVGRTGFFQVVLGIHYNNPGLVDGFTDSSGMRMFVKPVTPDVHDLTLFVTGQVQIDIPPDRDAVSHVGVCPPSCTKTLLTKPVYVIGAVNHMHLLGKSMKIEVFRDSKKIADLTNEENFNYNSPVFITHNPPIEILPGDEIRTTCVFSSLSVDRYVRIGRSTKDEMCFGFIQMYPSDAVIQKNCVAVGSLSTCNLLFGEPVGQCNWMAFTNFAENSQIVNDAMKFCNHGDLCRRECRDALKGLENHPCLAEETLRFLKYLMQDYKEQLEFLARVRSCPFIFMTDMQIEQYLKLGRE